MKNKYQHLKHLDTNDNDRKNVLPVNDYTKIKTQERPRVDFEDELVAELTKLGWVVVSPRNSTKLLIYCFLNHLCMITKIYVAWTV